MSAPVPEVDPGLVEVLRVHASHLGWVPPRGVWNAECLGCDWRDHGETGGGPAAVDAHRAHLARAVQSYVDEQRRASVARMLEQAAVMASTYDTGEQAAAGIRVVADIAARGDGL